MKKEQIANVKSYLNSLKMEVSSELGINPTSTKTNKTNKDNKQQKKS